MSGVSVRAATEADIEAIAAIAIATGQHDEWSAANAAYTGHLMLRGRVVVAELRGKVAGFGAAQRLGTGPGAVTILCDLFVDPTAQGNGCGRAMLTAVWAGAPRRMTFSSLHSNAVPLYTSFGLDAWWPLLYLHRQPGQLPTATGWAVERTTADDVAQLEFGWTGLDRTADHRAWNARPGGAAVIASAGERGRRRRRRDYGRAGARHPASGPVASIGRHRGRGCGPSCPSQPGRTGSGRA